VKETLTPYINT